MMYISDIVNSFDNYSQEFQEDFDLFLVEKVIEKYGFDFVVNLLADKEFNRHYSFGHKTDAFYRKMLNEKKQEIRKQIESKFISFLRNDKINKILI